VTHHLQNGKAIIDCGATSALGSVDAIESLMQLNVDRHGRDCVTVDPNNRPTFRFGNNGVHNVPNQPVLISVRALRKLGAVIDFPACAVKFCAKMLPESCSATGSGKQMDSGNSNGQVLPHAEPNQPESPSQSPDQNNQLAASAFAQKQQQPVGQLCAFVPLASSQASPCPHHAKGDLCRPDCQDDRVGRATASPLDCHAAEGTIGGTSCSHERSAAADFEESHGRSEQGCQEEVIDGGLAEKMHVSITPNMTIAQIYSLAALVEFVVAKEAALPPYEKMSFGQYRDLTYIEVVEHCPSYVTWAIQTVEENGDHGWLLQIRNVGQELRAPGSDANEPQSSPTGPSEVIKGPPYSRRLLRRIFQPHRDGPHVRDQAASLELELAASRTKSRGET
jgi:hypothetical protein